MQLMKEYCGNFIIKDNKSVIRYLKEFENEDKEFFVVLGLNSRNAVIYREIVSIGTLNSCLISPREIFKKAIMMSANNIIIAHNHPSGNEQPSEEDKNITTKLIQGGKLLDIALLDHIIITPKSNYSFNEHDLI